MDDLHKLLASVLQVDMEKISESISMSDLDSWDSLTHMDLITSIEKRYKIELDMDEIMAMTDISSIKEVLKKKNAY